MVRSRGPLSHFRLLRVDAAPAAHSPARADAGPAPNQPQPRLAYAPPPLAPCHPPPAPVLSFSPFRLVSSRCRSGEERHKPETARKEKTMKLEDIKKRTKDAVEYLVESLESGKSEVLTDYLSAMARFHDYSFGNVMLIARQRAVT